MDIALYLRVLWRYRTVVAVGLGIAVVLAFFTAVRVGPDGFSYRESQLWESTTRLGVTQNGFPWGRLFAQTAVTSTLEERAAQSGIPIADPNRFKDLAFLYAELANTDPVRRLMLRDGPIEGEVRAEPVLGENQITLPLVDVTGIAPSPEAAAALSVRAAKALVSYVEIEQRKNAVPSTDRVVLERLRAPQEATIAQARSKTMPLVVFLAVAFATMILVFLLENEKLRVRVLEDPQKAKAPGLRRERRRRTA